MGHVAHKAIIVTTFDRARADGAIEAANLIGLKTMGPHRSEVNGYYTTLICPSGSKTGCDSDTRHKERLAEFTGWLRAQRYEDDSSPFEWAMVYYGSDLWGCGETPAQVVDHEWLDRSDHD